MNRDEILKGIEEVGPWLSSNTYLGDGIYTKGNQSPLWGNGVHSRLFMQCIKDIMGSFDGLRILDLGSLEGLHSIEPALQGAEVVSVEGREEHCKKQRFIKDVLGLDKLHVYCDDVRNVTKENYGEFDVIINAGILYHLDFPEQIDWMENLAKMCKKLMLIHTNITVSEKDRVEVEYKDIKYSGKFWQERNSVLSDFNSRSSINNERSFILEKGSLYKILNNLGFNIAFERQATGGRDIKRAFLAIKGEKVKLKAVGELKIQEVAYI